VLFAGGLAAGMLTIIGGAVVSFVVFFLRTYVEPHIWPSFQIVAVSLGIQDAGMIRMLPAQK
jgi:hypothetical protein